MTEYTINRNNEMYLPAEVRIRWDIADRSRDVQLADLGDGILVIPNAEQWALVEAYYPDSDLGAAAEELFTSYEPYTEGELRVCPNVFVSRKVGRAQGNFSLPPSTLGRWGVSYPAKIAVTDLNSGVLLTPVGSTTPPENIVPVDMLTDCLWRYNWDYEDGRVMTPFLMESYRRWTRELGRTLAERTYTGGTSEGLKPDRDETQLGLTVGTFVLRSTLQSALDNLQKPVLPSRGSLLF